MLAATVAHGCAWGATAREREPAAASFSGDAAHARLATLMTWPRGLGDPRRVDSIARLEQALVDGGLRVERMSHVGRDPATGTAYPLTTLIGESRPAAPRALILASHFDTRPWADEEPDAYRRHAAVPGANDGTSGVAVVLELLPLLAERLPEDVSVIAILFDGEELGRPELGGYCAGSRELALRRARGGHRGLGRASFGIVLDMVGDARLSIPIEPSSARAHPALVDHVWETARVAGHSEFERRPAALAILDDHTFLTEAGVPSILLIDYDYPEWHTAGDDLSAISARSLGIVGDVVLRALVAAAHDPTGRLMPAGRSSPRRK